MVSYEEFMNQYCDFMDKYEKSNGADPTLVIEYADYVAKYAQAMKDFEAWESKNLNATEAAYYLDVQTRINQKLAKFIQKNSIGFINFLHISLENMLYSIIRKRNDCPNIMDSHFL